MFVHHVTSPLSAIGPRFSGEGRDASTEWCHLKEPHAHHDTQNALSFSSSALPCQNRHSNEDMCVKARETAGNASAAKSAVRLARPPVPPVTTVHSDGHRV